MWLYPSNYGEIKFCATHDVRPYLVLEAMTVLLFVTVRPLSRFMPVLCHMLCPYVQVHLLS